MENQCKKLLVRKLCTESLEHRRLLTSFYGRVSEFVDLSPSEIPAGVQVGDFVGGYFDSSGFDFYIDTNESPPREPTKFHVSSPTSDSDEFGNIFVTGYTSAPAAGLAQLEYVTGQDNAYLSWEPAPYRNNEPRIDIEVSFGVDVLAKKVLYVPSVDYTQDYLHLEYNVTSLPSDVDVNLGLFWSTDGTYDMRQTPAGPTGGYKADRQGWIDIPVSSLSNPPNASANFLVLHVDDNGKDLSGDIQEPDETNNTAHLDITPDIVAGNVTWNYIGSSGGATANYEIKNRYWLATSEIMVQPLWDTTPAGDPLTAFRDRKSIYIPAHGLGFLPETAMALRVNFDPTHKTNETDTTNNQNFKEVNPDDLKPDVTIKFVSARYSRKEPYLVYAGLQSRAPMDVHYKLDWQEDALDPGPNGVRAYIRGVNEYDATFGGKANRRADGYQIDLLAKQVLPIDLGGTDQQGAFLRTWNWIPPVNKDHTAFDMMTQFLQAPTAGENFLETYKELQKLAKLAGVKALGAWETLGAAVEGITDSTRILDALEFPKTYPSAKIHYRVSVEAISAFDGLTVTAPEDVSTITLKVQDGRKGSLQAFRAASLTIATDIALIKKNFSESDAERIEAALFKLSGQLDAVEKLYLAALDPPDPAFTSIVQLKPLEPLPAINNWYGLLQNGFQADRVVAAIGEAIQTTEDRWLGATIAGDALWASDQLIALSSFATQKAAAYNVAIRVASLTDLSSPSIVSSTELRDILATGEIPPSLASAFAKAGTTGDVINIFKTVVASSGETTNYANRMRALNAWSAAQAGEQAMAALIEAVEIRTSTLGLPVRAPNSEELDVITAEREEAERLFDNQLPAQSALARITDFIGRVRSLILETNNVSALLDDLRFGYGALFALPELGATPAEFVSVVQEQEAKGQIAGALAQTLISEFSRSQALFVEGDINGGFASIAEIARFVSEAPSADIDAALALQLGDALAYQLNINSTSALYPSSNPINALDVNDDGFISPMDVLLIINQINSGGTGPLYETTVVTNHQPYFDCYRDGFLSPMDALLVINYLNSHPGYPIGEGEAQVVFGAPTSDVALDARFAPLIMNWEPGLFPLFALEALPQKWDVIDEFFASHLLKASEGWNLNDYTTTKWPIICDDILSSESANACDRLSEIEFGEIFDLITHRSTEKTKVSEKTKVRQKQRW